MKNPLLVISLLAVLLSLPYWGNCQKKHHNCALEELNLKGIVKCLENRQYIAVDTLGKITKGRRVYNDDTYTVHFDNFGNAVKTFNTDFDGNLINYGEFEMDSMNYRIETRIFNGEKELINHTLNKNKYDKEGNIIEIKSASTIKSTVNQYYKENKTQYEYDYFGNHIASTSYDSQNNLDFKTIYKYNDKNRLTEEIHLNPEGKTLARELYAYDKKGNRILLENYASEGRLVAKLFQQYDTRNNLIDNIMYDLRDGKWVMDNHLKYKYNRHNNRIEEKNLDEKGKVLGTLTFKYTYDKQGNWIECVKFVNNKPELISERIFEYY